MLRHQLILSHTQMHPQKSADVSVALWEQLSVELIAIIGESGFDSLYARSIYLIQTAYPWLNATVLSPHAKHRFAGLHTRFAEQAPALVAEANKQLLITFTDILASLIGEDLTIQILGAAWGQEATQEASKELKK